MRTAALRGKLPLLSRASAASALACESRSFDGAAKASAVSSTPICKAALSDVSIVSVALRKARGRASNETEGSRPTAIATRAFAEATLVRISASVPLMEGDCGFATTVAAAAFVSGVTPIEGDDADAEKPGTTASSAAFAGNASWVRLRSLKKVALDDPVTRTTNGPL